MKRMGARAIVLAGLLASNVVSAQPGVGPAPEPPQQPQPPPPPAQLDSPEVEALYQQALGDFAAGRFEQAAREFADVATRTVDTGRQISANEMARQARQRALQAPPPMLPPPLPPASIDPRLNPPTGGEFLHSRDARYVLLIGTTLAGLAFYGPELPILVDSSSDKAQVGLFMLGAGASFLIPYVATTDATITWGMADAWWDGASRGAWHGVLVYGLLHDPDSNVDSSFKTFYTSLALGSLVEGIAFTAWAREAHATPGLTNAMNKGTDFGLGYGLGIGALIRPSDGNFRHFSAVALIGAAGGYVGGYSWGIARNPSWGDGEFMRAAGALGVYASAIPLILGEVDNERVVAGTLLAGASAGLVAGDYLLRGHRHSVGQGIITELATYAGGLAGAGIGFLVSPENSSNEEKFVAVGGILGAVGGFALAYSGLDTKIATSIDAATK